MNNHHHNITNPLTFRVTDCSVRTTFIPNNITVSVVLGDNTYYSKSVETNHHPYHISLIHYLILMNNHHQNVTNPLTFRGTDYSVRTTLICNNVTVSVVLGDNTYYSKSLETHHHP
jgi:hypothetical protein